jgi:SAM-dependent methyltransferase
VLGGAGALARFLDSAPGRYLLAWEQGFLDRAVADVFGYHALQLGMPRLDALRENRMPLRALALEATSDVDPHAMEVPAQALIQADALSHAASAAQAPARREVTLVAGFAELPFASQSLDLVVLPHVLERSAEPHRLLREVERVLVPEGQVVITGFNPASLWGAKHWLDQRLGSPPFLPAQGQLIALPRLKDWLKLLSFEASRGRFGCYVPGVRSQRWLARWSALDKAGDRWWPVLGGVYALSAVKRVQGMRLVGLARSRREELRATLQPAAPLAHCTPSGSPRPGAANDPLGGRHALLRGQP